MVVIGRMFMLALSMFLIFFVIYYFAMANVNVSDYFSYVYKTNLALINEKLAKLMNADSIVNLPNVHIHTTDVALNSLQKCKNGPIFIGKLDPANTQLYSKTCIETCGSQAKLIEITSNFDEYYSNGQKLSLGVWCGVNKTECNTHTGYVVATVNSVACRSKYPNMFGGINATKVIACNNEEYPSSGSVLYDYLNDQPVDPFTVDMTSEDELLDDGSYRFRCKFTKDANNNPYIEHPLNRFHPMRDYCKNTILSAHPSVGAKVTDTGWFCDCGDFNVTRVRNKIFNNPKSTCSMCLNSIDHTTNKYTFSFDCFNRNSPYYSVLSNIPCSSSTFVKQGENMCENSSLYIKRILADYRKEMPWVGIEGLNGDNNVVEGIQTPD